MSHPFICPNCGHRTSELDRNLGFTPVPCEVKVDKQVCCAGGTAAGQPCASDSVNWKDAGYDDNAINHHPGSHGHFNFKQHHGGQNYQFD